MNVLIETKLYMNNHFFNQSEIHNDSVKQSAVSPHSYGLITHYWIKLAKMVAFFFF